MGICEDAPDEYCGHVLEPAEGEADDDWHKETRNAVCLREPKYDGLCVWHADTDEKDAEELVEVRLTPDDVPWETDYVKEHLNGAILRGIEFPESFSSLRGIAFPERFPFGGCVLAFAEFSGNNFRSYNFSDAHLYRAEFSDTDLCSADFSDARLYRANFFDTDLRSAKFHNADLRSAEFSSTDLQFAKFPHADLRSARFLDAGLRLAEFPDAKLHSAEFPDAHLYRAEFPCATVNNAEFRGADIRFAEFYNADLRSANFSGAHLRSAEFPHADLEEAAFSDADLQFAEFSHASLENAEFSETNLQQTDLTEANLAGSELSGADLRDVKFRPAFARIVESGNGTPANPLGASLEDAQLEDGTDLRGADLSGARLYQTAFRDVRINDETTFGIEQGRFGEKCRYEYDPNTGVSTIEDVPRLRAAAWTYRRLESLFEERAMDLRARNAHMRKEESQRAYHAERLNDFEWIDEGVPLPDSWLRSLGEYSVGTVNWHLHRHGESLRQLIGASGILIFLCGIVYAGAGVGRNNPDTTYQITLADLTNPVAMLMDLFNGWYLSVITFSTIGYGDFYPASPLSRLLVGIESLAGALFIALFVFVIGRRVAR